MSSTEELSDVISIDSTSDLSDQLSTSSSTSSTAIEDLVNFPEESDDITMMEYLQDTLQQGNIDVVQYLFQHHNNIIQYFNTTTYPQNGLFHKVVESGNVELVQYIINHADIIDDINQLNELQQPPLYIAAINFQWDIVRLLLESKASLDTLSTIEEPITYSISSLLHYAVLDDDVSIEFIDYLINDIGIDVNSVNDYRITPVLYLAEANNIPMLKHFVEKHNANVHLVDDNFSNIFHHATYGCCKCTPELISYIYSCGADIEHVDSQHLVPILHAIQTCNVDVVQEFINCGARLLVRVNKKNLVYQYNTITMHEYCDDAFGRVFTQLIEHRQHNNNRNGDHVDHNHNVNNNYNKNDMKHHSGYHPKIDNCLQDSMNQHTDWFVVDEEEQRVEFIRTIRVQLNNISNLSVLTMAAQNNDENVIKLLLGYFYQDISKAFNPSTAIQQSKKIISELFVEAMIFDNVNVCKYLFEHYDGHKFCSETNYLQQYATTQFNLSTQVLSYLLTLNVFDINEIMKIEITPSSPIYTNIINGVAFNSLNSLNHIQLFIQHGADIHTVASNGYNIIHFVLSKHITYRVDIPDRYEILQYLLQLNVAQSTEKVPSALHLATQTQLERPDFVTLLIGHYIDQLLDHHSCD